MDNDTTPRLTRLGIASLVLGLAGVVLFGLGLQILQSPSRPDPDGAHLISDLFAIGILLAISACVHVAGVACAAIGLYRGGRPRWICIAGLVLNLGALPLVAGVSYIVTTIFGALM